MVIWNGRVKKGCSLVKRSRKRESRIHTKIKISKDIGSYIRKISLLVLHIFKRNEHICPPEGTYKMFIYCNLKVGTPQCPSIEDRKNMKYAVLVQGDTNQ